MSHVLSNRTHWDALAADYAQHARRLWARPEPSWGTFDVPQSAAPFFPTGLAGTDLLELGCGTAYVSAWAARAGARPVGVDNSARQLATARAMQTEFDLRFPLIQADAENVPLAAGRFDVVPSEYGASIWCDPYRWIPEAARLLRPGGRLTFLRNSTLVILCSPDDAPATPALQRPQRGLHRVTWESDPGVEFHLGHGDWVRLLRDSGFVLDDLTELYAPDSAPADVQYVTRDWARRWPVEEIWSATRG